MPNPFANWTPADVAAHNVKVTTKVRVLKQQQPNFHPAIAGKIGTVAESTDITKLNKTERAYFQWLRTREFVDWIGVQCLTLKLADDCRYTPDFIVIGVATIEAHEVKGFWRDDAKVKIKVAARMFPWIKFIVVQKEGALWKFTSVKP